MKIYCKNKTCSFYKFLDEPISFSFSQIYTPFEGDKCYGECIAPRQHFKPFMESIGDFLYEGADCDPARADDYFCQRMDCVHNEKCECTRSEILVDKLNDRWVCKCFSFRKVRGHMDWFSRLCNPDGTAKGGSIDDSYAERMDKWKKTTRSYRTHIKQNT